MLYNRPVAGITIKPEQAKELGKKFLKDCKFENMEATYFLKEDNVLTINYAYNQNNIIVYPDLIKIKIALDNGEIIGFESKGYLNSHTARDIKTPKISQLEAKALINKNIQVLASQLTIIPTNYKTELLTYEFKGKLNNKDFLIYINAETGKEENILIIIDTPNGVLTM